tara:strand:+ start:83 stop:685 length:603 start_codon:yes stop_codon:yes gene_type:complete
MSNLKQYLNESAKEYDFKIKIAGDIADDFATRMETALQKYDIKKLSAGKKTPIQEHPLDFPQLKNIQVNIFDLTTNYPVSAHALKEYVADYMRLSPAMVVVKKPGEPSEEYQADMNKKSEYKNMLNTIEMGSASDVKPEEMFGDKANMSLLKELLKDRDERYKVEKGSDSKVQKTQEKEDKPSESPLSKSTNPHPDPKRK